VAGPLSGFRVVDASTMISGPRAAMLLADQGADVIKLEDPRGGDGTRGIGGGRGLAPIFLVANRGKRSLALDLRQKRGVDVLLRLVASADVFLQNFRPGTAERMGIDEPTLRRARPELIYVSISGFGERGPYVHKRVYDPVIQALSGLASIQGDRQTGRPRMLRTIIPDEVSAVTAAQAITAALLARERGAGGQHVRLAMLDAAVALVWPEAMARYTLVREGGAAAAHAGPPQVRDLVFETRDGYMTAGVVSDREWEGLARAVGHPEWLEDPRFRTAASRVAHWDERLELMAGALATRTTAEWIAALDAAGVPCAPILSRRELLDDPQLRANELIEESDHPHAGRVRQPRPAARFTRTPAAIGRPAPLLGEHSDEVLREIGLAGAEIAELRGSGVVR
jgi:crotonobetainyl-CoA:carnitine CoA-transferase CaiB-like acyl-CoA transferase